VIHTSSCPGTGSPWGCPGRISYPSTTGGRTTPERSWATGTSGPRRGRYAPQATSGNAATTGTSEAIGITVLQINTFVRTAEFVIVLAPEARGKGCAAEATRLTLDWAFNLGALRMVWLKVLEPNRAGVAAYAKAGFRKSGRLRQSGFWLGKPVDEIIMDALPEDFPGPSAVAAVIGD